MKIILIHIAISLLTWNCIAQKDSISSLEYYRLYLLASGKYTKDGKQVQTIGSSYYVVVNVTDLKTLKTKEISIEYQYLQEAIDMDNGLAIIDEPNRIFKFSSDSALNYINFFSFDSLEMIKCLENLSAEILINNWNRNSIEFMNKYSGDCERYYAYVLFNHGILTGNGGVIKALHIIDGDDLERLKKRLNK
jgi:hypothetical protein